MTLISHTLTLFYWNQIHIKASDPRLSQYIFVGLLPLLLGDSGVHYCKDVPNQFGTIRNMLLRHQLLCVHWILSHQQHHMRKDLEVVQNIHTL